MEKNPIEQKAFIQKQAEEYKNWLKMQAQKGNRKRLLIIGSGARREVFSPVDNGPRMSR